MMCSNRFGGDEAGGAAPVKGKRAFTTCLDGGVAQMSMTWCGSPEGCMPCGPVAQG